MENPKEHQPNYRLLLLATQQKISHKDPAITVKGVH
jgi:hypothetical protein